MGEAKAGERLGGKGRFSVRRKREARLQEPSLKSFALPSTADNNGLFKLRFRTVHPAPKTSASSTRCA
jgi:hypothetical protein